MRDQLDQLLDAAMETYDRFVRDAPDRELAAILRRDRERAVVLLRRACAARLLAADRSRPTSGPLH